MTCFQYIRVFFVVLTLSIISITFAHSNEKKFLTFGIVPQQSATRLAKQWTPLTRYLSKRTGKNIIFKTAPNIPVFEQRLAAGKYDIAYMNPYHYTIFHQNPGYVAIAKEKDKKIQGIIVVRKDSGIETIKDLNNLQLAFPAPAAFAASLLPRGALSTMGVTIHPVYVKSHDSVYLNVNKGIYPAGGGITRTLQTMPKDIQANLKVLWKTQKYTPHAIAVHPRVPDDVKNVLQQVLINLTSDDLSEALLEEINLKGIEKAIDSDWDDVRSLQLDTLPNMKK